MATKIFYNDNRIIIDGHADTAEECQAITAMCDEMANSENFKTIVYEKGHAVFERVDGGDVMMFAMQDYVLTSRYNAETGYDAAELVANGTIKKRIEILEEALVGYNGNYGLLLTIIGSEYNNFEDYIRPRGSIAERLDALEALFARVSALESQTSKTLPYTADELAALLAKLENLE